MSQHFLSDEVCTLLQTYYTCEFTTVNGRGQPITWPCLPYFHPATGQILVTASIAFPIKVFNTRRYPKVSLLYSDPTGSGLTSPPAILIQGEATVGELLDHTEKKIISLYRVIQRRQPDNQNFTCNRFLRSAFTWYLFQRLLITVTPQRVRVWDQGIFTRCSMWNRPLEILLETYAMAVLSSVEDDGYPASIRYQVCTDSEHHHIRIVDPPTLATSWRGPASLLFHEHDAPLERLRQLALQGELIDEEGVLTFVVQKFITANGRADSDQMPHASSPLHMLRFFWLGRRNARTYLAKRREPWLPIPYDEITRLVAEVEEKER